MKLTRSTPLRVLIAALLVSLVGMIVQIASGVRYGTVPPGIVIVVVLALLLAVVPWPPVRILGVVVPAFILLGGFTSHNGRTSLDHPGHVGAFAGTIVQLAALAVAVLAGIAALVEWRAARRRDPRVSPA